MVEGRRSRGNGMEEGVREGKGVPGHPGFSLEQFLEERKPKPKTEIYIWDFKFSEESTERHIY